MGHMYMAEHGRSLLCHVLIDQQCVISDTLLLRQVSTNIVSHVRSIKTFIVSFAKILETFIVSTISCIDQNCVISVKPFIEQYCVMWQNNGDLHCVSQLFLHNIYVSQLVCKQNERHLCDIICGRT